MLRRLLLSLLIACLALPALAPAAMAMPTGAADAHCAGMMGAGMMGMAERHPTPAPEKAKHPALAMANHQCIGCIAGRHEVAVPATPALLAPVAPHARPMPLLTGLAYSPATPPPRT